MLYAGSHSRSPPESLGGCAPDEQRPLLRRRAGGLPTREALHVATAGVVEGDGRGAATAADPEGGRGAATHVGDGIGQVATTRSCVTTCFSSVLRASSKTLAIQPMWGLLLCAGQLSDRGSSCVVEQGHNFLLDKSQTTTTIRWHRCGGFLTDSQHTWLHVHTARKVFTYLDYDASD